MTLEKIKTNWHDIRIVIEALILFAIAIINFIMYGNNDKFNVGVDKLDKIVLQLQANTINAKNSDKRLEDAEGVNAVQEIKIKDINDRVIRIEVKVLKENK